MDDDKTQRTAAALERLFRTYQQSDRGDALDVALERMERAKVYFDAVAPYDIRDIEAACNAFITGNAPGVNPAFIPPAPQVGAEVRRQMNLRLDREYRDNLTRPKLAPPDAERTPESQARVRELMERTIGGLKRMTEDDDPVERHRSVLRKTNEYFDAERGFSVGDPEGAADAA